MQVKKPSKTRAKPRGSGRLNVNGAKKGLNVKDLRNGMKRVSIEAKVIEKGNPREVMSRYKDETYRVADAVIADETGSIKLTLWNEQIDQVNVDDTVKIENGYVTSFKGEIQLNVGKFGKLTVE
ncbi:MAG: OB-fold nucleic acid binding domain-containing protein [Candidatus Bathyarchaeota archaeon]|nr:OB-fold nucleic acid binding domain-containing protein [Candidatus Bathyarchaeota archaeon]